MTHGKKRIDSTGIIASQLEDLVPVLFYCGLPFQLYQASTDHTVPL